MAVIVGIYDNEEQVLEAIHSLREAGAAEDDLRVVVNNREGAPLLSANGHVRMEELYRIQEVRDDDDVNTPFAASVPLGVGYPVGLSAIGAGPTGAVLPSMLLSDGSGSAEVLVEIGVPEDEAALCARAVQSGQYVLLREDASYVGEDGEST
ncbi:hypothetical protein [Cohnella soli]|uniref:General stress protein 17M-like domain-containing protein n=1 Tax=Cohnella soli TaxID=425005 RepID=A0ABW0I361_9BACL